MCTYSIFKNDIEKAIILCDHQQSMSYVEWNILYEFIQRTSSRGTGNTHYESNTDN